MIRDLIVSVALTASALLSAAPAFACSVVLPKKYDRQDEWRDAKAKVRRATLIIDGEVVRLPDADHGALVRVQRVFKGPHVAQIEVGARGDCDSDFTRVGERTRMLLDGGPDVYFMRVTQGRADFVDRLLGSDRSKDWPYAPGREVPTLW